MPLSQYWGILGILAEHLFVCNQPSLGNLNIMDSKVYVCRIKYVMCRMCRIKCVGKNLCVG